MQCTHILAICVWCYIYLIHYKSFAKEIIPSLTQSPSPDNNIYFQIKLLLNHVRSLPTDTIVARLMLPLCNALSIGYQHMDMCCIISLQRPKSQRIPNPLVNVLATPIWVFRYICMRCCKGGSVVVSLGMPMHHPKKYPRSTSVKAWGCPRGTPFFIGKN
jgi:hypothetical protein